MVEAISQDRQSCQSVFLLDEKPTIVPVGSAGERSGGARKVPYGAACSNSERAAAMDCVGNRFRLSGRLEKIEPLRRGAWRGAGRQAEMAEDFDNHRRIFDRCDDLQGSAAVRALFDVDVEDPFEKPGPTHARRRTLRVRVIA